MKPSHIAPVPLDRCFPGERRFVKAWSRRAMRRVLKMLDRTEVAAEPIVANDERGFNPATVSRTRPAVLCWIDGAWCATSAFAVVTNKRS